MAPHARKDAAAADASPADAAREELTAYLDGELDPAASRRVEDRLKHDATYRQELQRLEQAWDMLDELDRAVTGEQFTRTTMQMVATAAADESRPSSLRWSKPAALGAIVALVAASCLGFAGGRWIWPDPNTQLLREMPVLESIDLYDQGDSIEFIRKLERAGLFDQAPDAGTPAPRELSAEEEIAERRVEIERMTPLERQHLRRKQDHFARYSLDEQRRMLRLYDDLDHDPHENELRRVLAGYHEWLDSLALSVRADLADLTVDERLAKIKELKQQALAQRQQELQGAPSDQDLQTMLRWSEEAGWQHRQALLDGLSAPRREYIEHLDEKKQRRAMLWLVFHQAQMGKRPQWGAWNDQAIAELVPQLSAGAQHKLNAQATSDDKRKMIAGWVHLAVRDRIEGAGLRDLAPPIDALELQRFLRDELNTEQRESILSLSRAQKHRLLLRLYFMPADRLAQVHPGQLPGWPQPANPDAPRGKARPKAVKRLKVQA